MKINSCKLVLRALALAIVAALSGTPVFADSCKVDAGIQSQNSLTVPELTNGLPTVVALNGESSKKNATAFQWTQTSGPTVELSYVYDNSTGLPVKASFNAPNVGPSGVALTFELTVSGCNPLVSSTALINVNITNDVTNDNRPPVAVATSNPSIVNENMPFTLDGSGSTDPDGNALSYSWSQVFDDGSSLWLSNSKTETFTAPEEPYPDGATLSFKLTVSDGYLSSSANTTVTVKWVNDPPLAKVSCTTPVNEGTLVTLDGSSSTDDEDGIVSYAWNQLVGLPNADLSQVDLSVETIAFIAPQLTSPSNTMTFGLTVTDKGGLHNSAQCDIVVLDITKPSIQCTVPDDIWYRNDVTVDCTASDIASGLADPNDSSFTLATSVTAGTETASAPTDSKQVCDNANNCDTAGSYTFKVDKKAPSVSCGTADTAWHATDQSVTCTATDGGSGPASQTVTLTTSVQVGTETSNASTGSQQACDNVNNCADAGPVTGFKVDKKAPSITASATNADGTSYVAGTWTNQNVTVKFTCSDGGSGVKTCPSDVTISTEGANQSASGTANDNVDNNASATFGPVKIDKTPPSVSCGSADGAWHGSDVNIACTSSDSGSGLLKAGDANFSLSTSVPADSETNNASTNSYKVCDTVGNCVTAGPISGHMIDKKAPTNITFVNSTVGDGASYYFGFVPPAPTCNATDNGSGLNSCVVTGYDTKVGSHTLTATATDNVGNTSTTTQTYTVMAWALTGFYQPVDMNGVWNNVKSGATVPLKFQVFAGPTEQTDVAAVDTFVVKGVLCPSANASSDDIDFVTTGGTILRYDTIAHQFIQNWQTPRGKAGACYEVTMTTDDGSSLKAYFKLK